MDLIFIINIIVNYHLMSTENMNSEGEMSQNNNAENKNDSIPYQKISDQNNVVTDFNCFHFIIAFLINLGLLIIAITEFAIRKKSSYTTTIFDFLVDIFIVFVCIFVITYFFTKKENFLKGFVYYPLCSLFWGIADLLTIFCLGGSHDWNIADTLKIAKLGLIVISILINISYMNFCNK